MLVLERESQGSRHSTHCPEIHFPENGNNNSYWPGYWEGNESVCVRNLRLHSANNNFYPLYVESSVNDRVSPFALAGKELIVSSGVRHSRCTAHPHSFLISLVFLFFSLNTLECSSFELKSCLQSGRG